MINDFSALFNGVIIYYLGTGGALTLRALIKPPFTPIVWYILPLYLPKSNVGSGIDEAFTREAGIYEMSTLYITSTTAATI